MTYEELVATVRTATQNMAISKGIGHVAYQFNVEGEGEGAFYLELDHGRINVEPYEYYDRDLIIVLTAQVLLQMTAGEIMPMEAFTNGQIKVYNGDPKKLELLPFKCSRKPAEKTEMETAEEAMSESAEKAAEPIEEEPVPEKAAEPIAEETVQDKPTAEETVQDKPTAEETAPDKAAAEKPEKKAAEKQLPQKSKKLEVKAIAQPVKKAVK